MISNDTLAEAISGLARAIRALNWNNRSCTAAALVEEFIAKALDKSKAAESNAEQLKQIAELRKMANVLSQFSKLVLPDAESVQIANASNLVAKHMPQQVSSFGGSSGEFGWTGIDGFGNRVSWRVEPLVAPEVGMGATPIMPTEMLESFADFAPAVTAAAEKRFADDPFASTFEVRPGGDAITIKLYPRPGSLQYLVSVTGPQSTSVRIESSLPSFVLVSRIEEVPR